MKERKKVTSFIYNILHTIEHNWIEHDTDIQNATIFEWKKKNECTHV